MVAMKLTFSSTHFVTSALDKLPCLRSSAGRLLPEIAIVGRSNVGKSSLINHLTGKKIARVSMSPGKTQLLNFFLVDDQVALVDFPGYGYARVPKHVKETWGHSLTTYLETRGTLALILLLIDSRHPPTEEDLRFLHWAEHHQRPLQPVFTKSDKAKGPPPFPGLLYSITDPRARSLLIKTINERLSSWD